MVSVILTILKIIGIALLVIIGLILLIALLVLFAPICYRAQGSYDEEGGARLLAKARWLIASVTVRYINKEEKPLGIKIKVLCFTIYDSLKEKKEKKKKKKKRERKEKPQDEIAVRESAEQEEAPPPRLEPQAPSDTVQIEEKTEDSLEGEGKKPSIVQNIRAFVKKLVNIFRNIKFTFEKICATIKKIVGNVQYYWNLLHEESTKRAFETCKKQLCAVLKDICPKKYSVKLHLGLDDPAALGELLGAVGMLYPLHKGRVEIQPDFEHKVMEGSFWFKGRAFSWVLARAVWILFTDKDIKKFRKQLSR